MESRSKARLEETSGARFYRPNLRQKANQAKRYRPRKTLTRGFDLEGYLHRHKALIDKALAAYLCGNGQPASLLHQAVCYGALDGGKRIRPILTLAVGELFGAKRRLLLPFASAIELIHCYSLIHDDLPALDNDDLRRGKPSCHKRFGEAIALLAGDALLTEAFLITSDPALARHFESPRMANLVREISEGAGLRGMIAGQSRELEMDKSRLTAADLEHLYLLKTGALITAAVRVGAIAGDASRADLERITRYGQSLGLAFQITDDMLDAHELSRGGDRAALNYLSLTANREAAERVRGLIGECLNQLQTYGAAAEPLRHIACYVAARTD